MHVWYLYVIYVFVATYKIFVPCFFLVVLNVFGHHKILYFSIVKCSTTIKSKVPLMYAAFQILVELIQTYKDVDIGAKVTKFLACA